MDVENEIQQTTEATNDLATRDELIEAVRAARETEGTGVEGGQVEPPAPAAAAPAAEPPAPEPNPDAEFEALLAKRRESHQEVSGAKARAERMLREAEEAKQRLIAEAQAEAKRLVEEERKAFQNRFRTSPTEALRELGDPNDVADAVLREGTPEAKALAKAQEEARLAREEAKKGGTALAELEKFKKDLLQRENAERYARVRDSFLTTEAPKTVAPALYAQHRTPDAVFNALNNKCLEWEADGLVRGKDFDDATLVKYVENESRKWLADNGFTLATNPANQVPAGGSEKSPGLATKVTANGTRTLAAAAGSERRTSPRPYHEMTPDEQRQSLIDEVAAARRANPDATS